jgi:protein-S-isoprenylcysteine O-methyltransferase Ste14
MRRDDPRVRRLLQLLQDALAAPPGRRRRIMALTMGALCHAIFAVAIVSMVYAMFFGLSRSLGDINYPGAIFVNLTLLVQFPLAHSLLLTRGGLSVLAHLVPGMHGGTLSTTTFAIIASIQLLLLFWLWTPSGIIWWQADGSAFYAICTAYAVSWILLSKAVFDAGADLQSGALGWLSLLAAKKPRFPDMPTLGLFRFIRQPIYLAFACTLWTVPTWTPDQFALAMVWTGYCVAAPFLKERRLRMQFGASFERYRANTPYMIPQPTQIKRLKEQARDVQGKE